MSLETIVYIILKRISEAEDSSIIKNSFFLAVATFIYIILIIKLNNKKFWPKYLPN